jgi:hypothetical protein
MQEIDVFTSVKTQGVLSIATVDLDTWSVFCGVGTRLQTRGLSKSFTMVKFDDVIVVFSHSFSYNTQSRPKMRVSAIQCNSSS